MLFSIYVPWNGSPYFNYYTSFLHSRNGPVCARTFPDVASLLPMDSIVLSIWTSANFVRPLVTELYPSNLSDHYYRGSTLVVKINETAYHQSLRAHDYSLFHQLVFPKGSRFLSTQEVRANLLSSWNLNAIKVTPVGQEYFLFFFFRIQIRIRGGP